jgi:hypothetical protein
LGNDVTKCGEKENKRGREGGREREREIRAPAILEESLQSQPPQLMLLRSENIAAELFPNH